MRVVLYGNLGAGQLGASYERALRQVGCDVHVVDTQERTANLAVWLRQRVLHRLTINSLRLRALGSRLWNEKVVEAVRVKRPSFLLVLKGDFLMPATIETVKQMGVPVFIFYPDNPLPGFPSGRPETLPSAKAADAYFIWSRDVQQKLQEKGCNVHYLPFGWDADTHPYAPYSGTGSEVVFIGNWDAHRERVLERVAERFDLSIWGTDYWQTRTSSRAVQAAWKGRPLLRREMSEMMSASKISLNIIREFNLPDGTNMRTFEIPGSGGFALSTYSTGVDELLPDGDGSALFKSLDELIEKTAHFLAWPGERQQIAERGHATVAASHQYSNRAEQIVALRRAL